VTADSTLLHGRLSRANTHREARTGVMRANKSRSPKAPALGDSGGWQV
jgi:hypothetical protein